MPLVTKAMSLNDKSTTMLMNKVKSGHALRTSSEEEYILDIFRREKAAIAWKLVIVNVVSLTIAIAIVSWTLFGLVTQKKK